MSAPPSVAAEPSPIDAARDAWDPPSWSAGAGATRTLGKLANGNILRALRQAEQVARRLQASRPASTATIERLDRPQTPAAAR